MQWVYIMFSCLAGMLTYGLIARLLGALFSKKSRQLIKTNPRRHLIWIFTVLVFWIFLIEFPNYLTRKYHAEAKRKFIELMQHDLRPDSRFADVAIDTNHLHFIVVTGTVFSVEQWKILDDWVASNRSVLRTVAVNEVMVVTNSIK